MSRPRASKPTTVVDWRGNAWKVPDIDQPEREGAEVRYLAYARSQGCTMWEVLARDLECYPEEPMTAYRRWIEARWREWHAFDGLDAWNYLDNTPICPPLTPEDHADFNAWLEAKYPRSKP